jgi:DUF1680 family protein
LGAEQSSAVRSCISFASNNAKKIPIKVNGEAVDYTIVNGYALINRSWKKNDKVEMDLPMDVQRVVANEKLADDIGKIALQRGPIMYCAEWVDNNGKQIIYWYPITQVYNRIQTGSLKWGNRFKSRSAGSDH